MDILRVLAQSRPSGTSNTTAYTKSTKQLVHVSHIIICNTTSGAVTYRIFLDVDGSTYDETTALYYDCTLGANATEFVDIDATMEAKDAGTVGVRTSSANAINFTIVGSVKDLV